MVRIVSGNQSDPNIALLQGQAIGQNYRAAQQQRREAESANMGRMIQMQELKLRMDAAQTRKQELLNEAAANGSVAALSELHLKAKQKPSEAMVEAGMALRSGVKNPEALKQMDSLLEEMIGFQQKHEQKGVAQESLNMAFKDGLIDEVAFQNSQQQLEAGGDPDAMVSGHLKLRKDKADASRFQKDNLVALQQAQALADTLPPNDPRRAAILGNISVYEQSPSLQEKDSSGVRLLQNVQQAMARTQPKGKADPFRDPAARNRAYSQLTDEGVDAPTEQQMRERIKFMNPGAKPPPGMFSESDPAPGLHGMTIGERNKQMMREPHSIGDPLSRIGIGQERGAFGGPKVPAFTGGTHATVRGANRKSAAPAPQAEPANPLHEQIMAAQSDQDVVKALRAAGVKITKEALDEAKSIRGSRAR